MFDLYAFPYDALEIKNIPSDVYAKAEHIEKAIADAVGNRYGNMIFSLVLHEFEGLLFSDVNAFLGVAKANDKIVAELQKIRNSFDTPEHINDSEMTAPSKRIARLLPEYAKILDGMEVVGRIGIDGISGHCQHFNNWVSRLMLLAKK